MWLVNNTQIFIIVPYCKTLSTKTRIVTGVIGLENLRGLLIAKHCPLKQGLWRLDLTKSPAPQCLIAKHCPLKQGLWLAYIARVPIMASIAKHCPLKQGLCFFQIQLICLQSHIAKHCLLKQGLWLWVSSFTEVDHVNCKKIVH